MKQLLLLLFCAGLVLTACDEPSGRAALPDNDVRTYVTPAAPTDRQETISDSLRRVSLDNSDVDGRVKRVLQRALSNISAAEPVLKDLNQVRITADPGCRVSYFNTRPDGVVTELRMNLNDFDYRQGLRLKADDGPERPYPGIGFLTKGEADKIEVYENGVKMQDAHEWELILDTRERVQQTAGDIILAMRICQDPEFQ